MVGARFHSQRRSRPLAGGRAHAQFVSREQPAINIVAHIETPAYVECRPVAERQIFEVDIRCRTNDTLVRIREREIQTPLT